ncbi:MAG: T9SS type A sorting domain-containing protein [Chitinophagaceae bacterium]|nr:T9SS type A sorting domain-containing protein [Chitinophagaceae bacterium]
MRFIFIYICLFSTAVAQIPNDYCKQVNNIAAVERMNHERLMLPASGETGASNNFDIKYIKAEWQVDPSVRYINGKVTLYFKIITATNTISLDLMNDLVVDSIKQRNATLVNQHTNNIIQINFSNSIAAGTLDSINIFYQGVPPTTGFGAFVQTTHATTPVIWTLSEPYGSRDWWPCKNGLDDKADSLDVFITGPSQYTAASNGLLQSETITGSQKITHWKHRYPIATYLVCFAITNYAVFNNSVQLGAVSLPMQTFCYPENLALFMTNTPLVLNAMQLYNNTFGEYPFIKEKYGHVQFGWGGGQEHQTSTFIVTPNEGLMAHELAHQWFGDKITCGSWQDIWLNEGFATHIASMYYERNYPANILISRKNEIANITALPGGSVWVDDTTNVNRIFDGRLSYSKGSHLLYMLRWIIGDSVFFKGLRQYQKDEKVIYSFARTADLQRNLEQVSGRDLNYFFKEWFYGQGYPSYNIVWNQLGSNYVRVKMNQVTSHPSVPFYELPVALEFKNATMQKTVILNNKFNGEYFFENIGFIADTVLVDPDYWLITRNNTSVKETDNITGQNVISIFPNPVQDQLYMYFANFNLPAASINIYNAAGQLVYKKQLSVNGSEFLEVFVKNLSRGIYIVRIQSGTDIKYSRKIVKD